MFSLEELFCHVDDFCQKFEAQWHKTLSKHGGIKRVRAKSMCLSEIMTILIAFHQNHYRNFKHFYLEHVRKQWGFAFPGLPSYQRFVEWMPSVLVPLCAYLKHCFGKCTGIGFADSTSLKVCHNRRIPRNKVFKGFASRGKTSVDWFYGFKLHLVVSDSPKERLRQRGEILNAIVTPGNIDDRKPIPDLLSKLFGKFFADRGYVSKELADKLFKEFGIEFFAKPRRNMKNHLIPIHEKYDTDR